MTGETRGQQSYREIAWEMRLEEEGAWDCSGEDGIEGLLSLREKGWNREDNLERTFEDAIGVRQNFWASSLVNSTKGLLMLSQICFMAILHLKSLNFW